MRVDVFRYDFATGAVTRVSVGTGGVRADGGLLRRHDERRRQVVAFDSSATNLGPAAVDNGTLLDVFVHDTQTGETTQNLARVRRRAGQRAFSRGRGAARTAGGWPSAPRRPTSPASPTPTATEDAHLVQWRTGVGAADCARGGRAGPQHRGHRRELERRLRRPGFRGEKPRAGAPSPSRTSWCGTVSVNRCSCARVLRHQRPVLRMVSRPQPVRPLPRSRAAHLRERPCAAAGRLFQQVTTTRIIAGPADGQFGLSLDGRSGGLHAQRRRLPARAGGAVRRAGALGRCRRRRAVQRLGGAVWAERRSRPPAPTVPTAIPTRTVSPIATSSPPVPTPRGTTTRHLAEGAQNAFFDTRLALLNPGGAPAHALVRFLRAAAVAVTETLEIPAHQHRANRGARCRRAARLVVRDRRRGRRRNHRRSHGAVE